MAIAGSTCNFKPLEKKEFGIAASGEVVRPGFKPDVGSVTATVDIHSLSKRGLASRSSWAKHADQATTPVQTLCRLEA